MNLKSLLNPPTENLARLALYRLQLLVIVDIFIYFFYDLFIGKSNELIIQSLIPLVIYSSLAWALYKRNNPIFERIAISLSAGACLFSFLVLGGITNITMLDFTNSVLLVSICFRGRERIVWLLIHALIFISVGVLYNTIPFIFTNTRPGDHEWFNFIEMTLRIVNSVVVGSTFKFIYDKENEIIFNQKTEIKVQRDEIIIQNEKLRKTQKELEEINDELGKLINVRTNMLENRDQKIQEYAYINSHMLNAPLARLKGLMYLLQTDEDMESRIKYFGYFVQTLNDLEEVIKHISIILSEEDSTTIISIQEKVKKLYSDKELYL